MNSKKHSPQTLPIQEWLTPDDMDIAYYRHTIKNILFHQQTPYQEVQIVDAGAYGKALLLDGQWQSSTVDEFIYHEALVHPACITHQAPKKVLVLGGGEGATIREVLRWQTIEQVRMIDIDAEVIAACQEYLPEMHQNAFQDPRLTLTIGDAYEFVMTTEETWDIIISDVTDPTETGPSYNLFTKSFLQQLQNLLAPGGVFVQQAGAVTPVKLKMFSFLNENLRAVFPNVQGYTAQVPTFADPWGFLMVSSMGLRRQLSHQGIDQKLAQANVRGLRFIDGQTMQGIFCLPLYVRKAIEAEHGTPL